MAYLPVIANELWETRKIVTAIQSRLSITHSLPVSPYYNHVDALTGHTNGNQIYMNHPLLPPMKEYDINGQLLNGHAIGEDWVYLCWGQQLEGVFHMTGAPGLFTIGARKWVTNNNNNDDEFKYTIYINDGGSIRSRTVTGNELITIPLNTWDSFWLTYTYDTNQSLNYSTVQIDPESRFLLTRVSTMA